MRPSRTVAAACKPNFRPIQSATFELWHSGVEAFSPYGRPSHRSSLLRHSWPRMPATSCTTASSIQINQYQALVPINPGDGDKSIIPDIVVAQGRTQQVQVAGPDGRPGFANPSVRPTQGITRR